MHGELIGEQAFLGEVIERRQEQALRQIAGRAEDDDRARVGWFQTGFDARH